MQVTNKKNKVFIYLVALSILVVAFLMDIILGSSNITLNEVFSNLFNKENDEIIHTVLWKIRIPKAIVALVAGATLAASGTLIKAVMKNPLADTGLLGIQSGATLVAMVIILMMPNLYKWLPLGAFLGGFLVYMLLTLVAFKDGIKPIRLILSGIAINGFLASFISLISIYNSDKIQGALSWLNGSLAGVTMKDAQLILIYGGLALMLSLLLIGKCNLLLLDDVTIINLGENLSLTRFIVSTVAVLLASVSVAIVGIISFVGLVIPHIARLIIGQNHKDLLPLSIILGGAFLLIADILQKIIFSPMEIPIGIVISFVGAPFFLYQLRKQV